MLLHLCGYRHECGTNALIIELTGEEEELQFGKYIFIKRQYSLTHIFLMSKQSRKRMGIDTSRSKRDSNSSAVEQH